MQYIDVLVNSLFQQASGEGAAHTAQFPQNRPGRAGRKRLQVNPFLKANSDARIRYVKNWWARKGLPVRSMFKQTRRQHTQKLCWNTFILLPCRCWHVVFPSGHSLCSDDPFVIADGNSASFQMSQVLCKEQDTSTVSYPVIFCFYFKQHPQHKWCMC